MSATLTLLGCGSSGGVPRLGPDWGACDPREPRNRRRRCSVLVTRRGPAGVTRVRVDTSPDLRAQLLDAGVSTLDGVVYTHAHADHVHGIDDLRMVVHTMGRRLPVWADPPTTAAITTRFGYAFTTPPGSSYPPICDLRPLTGPVSIDGPGGPVAVRPVPVEHGSILALGLRFGDLAYVPDVSMIPEASWPALAGLDCLVVDALRYKPHPTHAHLDLALAWIARARAPRNVVTNLHVDMDYATHLRDLPRGVVPAFDGLDIPFDPDAPAPRARP